jgi:PAS domain-containing protein
VRAHPDDVDRTLSRWAESVHSGDIFSFEYRLLRADKTYRWHLAKGMPIRDEHARRIVRRLERWPRRTAETGRPGHVPGKGRWAQHHSLFAGRTRAIFSAVRFRRSSCKRCCRAGYGRRATAAAENKSAK